MLGCTTALRPPDVHGPEAIARLAADGGFGALALTTGCTLDRVPALVRAAAGAGLIVHALGAPLSDGPLAAGKRLPWLTAMEDRDERLAALALVERTLTAAREAGAERVLVDLGPAPLTAHQGAFEDAFSRRALDEGEPGHRRFRDALAERRAIAPRLMDAARWSLERTVRAAERAGVALALGFAATPWQLPSPKEALELGRELAGAPLTLCFDTGRWAVVERLGLAGPPGRRDDLLAHAKLVTAADAVGLVPDLVPGLGELEPGAFAYPDATMFVTGRPDTTARELAQARDLIERARRVTPSASSGA